MKTRKKTIGKKETLEEPGRLSKLGIAVRDKTLPVFGKIVDMKAVLK